MPEKEVSNVEAVMDDLLVKFGALHIGYRPWESFDEVDV